MPEFCLTQISDTHLARRHQKLTDNFHRLSEHIDATRPDLVINSGDLAFDAPTSRDDLEFAKKLHDALPVTCRYLPGNHDLSNGVEEDVWREKFGRRYYHFVYRGVLFVLLNTDDPPGKKGGIGFAGAIAGATGPKDRALRQRVQGRGPRVRFPAESLQRSSDRRSEPPARAARACALSRSKAASRKYCVRSRARAPATG